MRFIGSKQLLLREIETLLQKYLSGNEETFLDLFGGTNSVGLYFKN
ncbi:DNA adenine methylase, partial [Enterococcus faecalis]|nr:DNA adenine methylase [Enterococcus faecalis]